MALVGSQRATTIIRGREFSAVLFDLDGVVTDTASLHAAAWKRMFDDYLSGLGGDQSPFTLDDYRRYVDGRERTDGVATFLRSRGVDLPRGGASDPPSEASLNGLGTRKDLLFQHLLVTEEVPVFAGTVNVLRLLRAGGVLTAVVSASRNARQVLDAVGLTAEFDIRVDGVDANRLGLPGKPAPAMFLEAARRLGVEPRHAVVVEDSSAGVRAARSGGFGFVIGIDRDRRNSALDENGADVVVDDLEVLDLGISDPVRQAGVPDPDCRVCAVAAPSPWLLTYGGADPATEGTREALLTLGNGYLGTRGALPEAHSDGTHYPGVYLAGCYNRVSSVVDGALREDESMVNLPNWLDFTFRAEEGPWLRPGSHELLHHHMTLDLRRGVLIRESVVRDGDGRRTRIRQRRVVSMNSPHLAGLETVLVAENWSGRMTVRSGLDGGVRNSNVAEFDGLEGRHLTAPATGTVGGGEIWLRVETNQSRVRVAQAARTSIRLADGGEIEVDRTTVTEAEAVRHELTFAVAVSAQVLIEKIVATYTSRDHAISEPVLAARQAAADAPEFAQLLAASEATWHNLWRRCEVVFDADTELRLAANVQTFHVLQTLSPHTADLDVGVPARGLHGEAYRGHVFWDDIFVLPFLTLRLPELARALLEYRFRRLGQARRRAQTFGRRGAAFPWQSGSDGRDETPPAFFNRHSGRWMPDNSARQFHVNLAVAYNVWHYWEVTADFGFLATFGAELLVENARFWSSLATYDADADRYDLCGVMGPDEFHDGYPDLPGRGIDNNTYVNVMTAWSLARVLDTSRILGEDLGLWPKLGVTAAERGEWEHLSRRLRLEFLDNGILSQFRGYGDLDELDLDDYRARYGSIGRLDLLLEAEGDSCNRYKVSKQADVLMLLYLFTAEELTGLVTRLGYEFDPASIPDIVEYYLARTSHGSTLSRVSHAWVLARGNRRESWQMLRESLDSDLGDSAHDTTREGIHLGAMAGSVDILQRCYSGLDVRGDTLWLHPQLPAELSALEFDIRYRDHWLHVRCDHTTVTVSTSPSAAAPVRVNIHDETYLLTAGASVTVLARC
ncbi:beta-phosphoglucomutase family hydrolase [Rhodococcus tukisamuensis]|uniref:Haloacid dehalogenase superfamily, subfamily IA, variant 3 with third motif having DD or ED/beta-phosphoglucomutase family hydrolase n=1 Tax=Rhodococcus tukisamuensis TaxID=168276 RepID=A0A1G6UBM5_9NOCA|nr:beta-phosphoglucomutase family hydrolase [Rhodococcus tukisamuensis]SDD38802.1 haloacid dehalogenase superfamily, subfamily IA, variant 3 with third motif having DD or ED/beta-phosphoglucomutase family hydrolase [Rhodococcus tukisamuensis]